MVKSGETLFETPCRMVVWVNILCTLDWIVRFCHKTAEIYFLAYSCSTGEYTKIDAVMAGGDELSENLNPL